MTTTIVDPPSGWMYGFPKVFDWNEEYETLGNWFIRNGYPEKHVQYAIQMSRYWNEPVEER